MAAALAVWADQMRWHVYFELRVKGQRSLYYHYGTGGEEQVVVEDAPRGHDEPLAVFPLSTPNSSELTPLAFRLTHDAILRASHVFLHTHPTYHLLSSNCRTYVAYILLQVFGFALDEIQDVFLRAGIPIGVVPPGGTWWVETEAAMIYAALEFPLWIRQRLHRYTGWLHHKLPTIPV